MLTTLLMDRYRLGPLLTHGQHSRIHWAHDTWTSHDVVCKVIDYTQSATTLREHVDRQYQLTQRLQHPGILQIHNVFHDQFRHTYYVFMDAYLSQSLRQQIVDRFEAAHLYDESTIWMVLAQLCDVLAYLHSPYKLNCPEVGIVIHRNIRPETIFLSNNTACVLGGMRQAVSLSQASEISEQVGDYVYMAPEMLLGHKYGAKVDMFMLGCVLHEMCTLRRYRETCANKQEAIQSLSSFVKTSYHGYSAELTRIINLLLDHNPRSRPPADELLKHPRIHKAWSVYRDYLKEHGPIVPPPQLPSAFESLRSQVSKAPAYWTKSQQDPLITVPLHQSQYGNLASSKPAPQDQLVATKSQQQTFKSNDYSNTCPENYGYSAAATSNLQTLFRNVSNSIEPGKSTAIDHQVQLSEDTKKIALTPNATLLATMPTAIVAGDTQNVLSTTSGTLPVTISDDISWANYWKDKLEKVAQTREELLDENKLVKDYKEKTQKDIFSDMETNLVGSDMGLTPYRNDGPILVKSARVLSYAYGKPGDTFPARPDDKAETIHDMTDYTRQTKRATYNTTEYKNTLMQKPDRSDISTSEINTPLTAVSPYDHSYCWDPNLPVRSQVSPSAPYDVTITASHARGLSYSTLVNPEPGENETVKELSHEDNTPYNTISISGARELSVSNQQGYRGDNSSLFSVKDSTLYDTLPNENTRQLSGYTPELNYLSNRSVLQAKDPSMQYESQREAEVLSQQSSHVAWKEEHLSVKSLADPSTNLSGDLNDGAFIHNGSTCEINQVLVDKGVNCSLMQNSVSHQKNQQSSYYDIGAQNVSNLNHYLVKGTYNMPPKYSNDKSQIDIMPGQVGPSTHLVDRGNSMPGQVGPSTHLVDRGNSMPGQVGPSTHLVDRGNSMPGQVGPSTHLVDRGNSMPGQVGPSTHLVDRGNSMPGQVGPSTYLVDRGNSMPGQVGPSTHLVDRGNSMPGQVGPSTHLVDRGNSMPGQVGPSTHLVDRGNSMPGQVGPSTHLVDRGNGTPGQLGPSTYLVDRGNGTPGQLGPSTYLVDRGNSMPGQVGPSTYLVDRGNSMPGQVGPSTHLVDRGNSMPGQVGPSTYLVDRGNSMPGQVGPSTHLVDRGNSMPGQVGPSTHLVDRGNSMPGQVGPSTYLVDRGNSMPGQVGPSTHLVDRGNGTPGQLGPSTYLVDRGNSMPGQVGPSTHLVDRGNSMPGQVGPSTHLVDRGNSMPGQVGPSTHLVDRGNGTPGQLGPSTHLVDRGNGTPGQLGPSTHLVDRGNGTPGQLGPSTYLVDRGNSMPGQVGPSTHLVDRGNSMPGQVGPSTHLVDRGNGTPGQLGPSTYLVDRGNSMPGQVGPSTHLVDRGNGTPGQLGPSTYLVDRGNSMPGQVGPSTHLVDRGNSMPGQVGPSTHLVDRGNSMPGQVGPSTHLVDRGNGTPGQLGPSTHLVDRGNSMPGQVGPSTHLVDREMGLRAS